MSIINNLSSLPMQGSNVASLLNDKYNSESDCRSSATLCSNTLSQYYCRSTQVEATSNVVIVIVC